MTQKLLTITLTGPFDNVAVSSIIALVRHIDGRDGDGHYEILINDPHSTIEDAEEMMRHALPSRPDRKTSIRVLRKQ